ncbi:nuclear hormone receptor [Holotrichia oblita]|uniref:Nuclear hormone receptor n=1 Tax=Holotrichia oblita TaxID=644536 RepID=A0ACB9TF20_HOLOL|nr:nuclear hormone receptor [Holotrichia oblita]
MKGRKTSQKMRITRRQEEINTGKENVTREDERNSAKDKAREKLVIEYTDMLLVFGFCEGNTREKFQNCRIPSHPTFAAVERRLRFAPGTADYGRQHFMKVPEVEEEILERVEKDPEISTRRIGMALEQFLYPYHKIAVQDLLEQMEEPNSQMKAEALCKVCGDKASGKHYGVASCDGCRGFFKRSIRRNLEYVCKENGRCIVDVTRRNQCQACRFRKCLQVNMKRDAVQHERAPRSAQSSIHHYPLGISARYRDLQTASFLPGLPLHIQNPTVLEPGTFTPSALQNSYLQHSFLYPSVLNSFGKSPFATTNTLSCHQKNTVPFLAPSISRINVKEDEVSSSEESNSSGRLRDDNNSNKDILSHTTKSLDLPLLHERKPLHVPCLSLFPAENVYESAAKLLFLSIKWARTIPSFLQLSYRDQSILLEESWSELFVLTAAQWALSVDEALLVSNAMAPTARHSVLEEDARKLREIISRLTLLRVDHTEHACLKALVLFKAECRGLCEPAHVELLQDQTHVMLHEYCSQSKSSHKGRFGKLLLTLPAVQAVSRQGLEELLFRQTVGDVAIDRLLGDLAKVTNNN